MIEYATISYERNVISLSPAAKAEMEDVFRRLNDPQDLEDGLLCVAYDEAREEMIRLADEYAKETVLKSLQ